MKELTTEIVINASPERVWQVLTDFHAFPSWNSFIPSIKGQALKGARLRIFIKPPLGKGMRIKPLVVEAEVNKELRWKGSMWGMGFLFSGEHFFIIEAIDDKIVKFIHGERFTGLLLPLFWNLMNERTKMGFIQFNKDLKKECELINVQS